MTSINIAPKRLANLRSWNLGLSILHIAQAIIILNIAGDFSITVTSTFPDGPPGTRITNPDGLFGVNIGWCIAIFLALAAVDHFATATFSRSTYETDLAAGINRFRWVEYSISATIMVLLISAYAGITDITGIVAIAGANISMILFGWLQERMNPPGRTKTTMMPVPHVAGTASAIIATITTAGGAVLGNIASAQFDGTDLYGEKAYLVLSLAAKSVLAWQIYGGSLAD